MPVAQDMKSLTDKIVGDYEARVSVLGNLISDTHDTLRGFNRDRTKMGAQLKRDLGGVVGNLVDTTGGLLKGFASEHKKMAEAQAKNLAKSTSELESTVKRMLKDFRASHAEMSEKQGEDLGAFVKSIVKETKGILAGAQKLMSEHREDISGASDAWQKMAGQMGRLRHGVAIRIGKGKPISAGIEVGPAAEAAPKRKRGRPRRRK